MGNAYDSISYEVELTLETLTGMNSRHRYRGNLESGNFFTEPKIKKIYLDALRATEESSVDTITKSRITTYIADLENTFDIETLTRNQIAIPPQARKFLSIQLTERETELKKLLRAGRQPRYIISEFPVSEPITYAAEHVTAFFRDKVKYLGPLRDEPKSIYPLAGYNDPNDIGFRGEFTAAVLDNNKTTFVKYIPSSAFPFDTIDSISLQSANLVDAVKDWLEYLGIANKVATEDKGKFGHELTISTASGNNFHDLTHVGVGVSQALPIVVLSLLADSGSTLIFEQPELHLNPKVQTRLADFFMSLIFAGKQCVIETHSEYLITRLRYLSAVSKDIPISDLIKIYFVEKPSDQSIYNEVQINSNGVIKNWPEGFFDETERNSAAIIQAQIERSIARRRTLDAASK